MIITEDYVSFEIAKLLKEKGFELPSLVPEEWVCTMYDENGKVNWGCYSDDWYCRITLQMAMKWLRKKHNILLVVDYEYECDTTPYYFKIYLLGENGKPERVAIKGVSYDKNDNATEHIVGYCDCERSKDDYSNEEQAYEAGIRYCLENLI